MSEQKGPPRYIWLQYHGDAPRDPDAKIELHGGDVTWNSDKVWDSDYCYIRASVSTEQAIAAAYHEGQRSVIEVLREVVEANRAMTNAHQALYDSGGEGDTRAEEKAFSDALAAADAFLSQHPNTLPHE